MKKAFTLSVIFFIFLIFQLEAQNAIVGTGFSTGWGTNCSPSPDNNDFSFLSSHVSVSYGNPKMATGAGNQFFRLGIDWDGTVGQHSINTGSNTEVFSGVEYTLNSTCTNGASMFTNVTNISDIYYFKTFNAGSFPAFRMIFFKIQGTVRFINTVSQSPIASSVKEGDIVTVTANLNASFATGQAVFLRYSTNMDLSSSTIVKMIGAEALYTATIPSSPEGANIYYYIFTSGDIGSISPANADFYTINLNNDGGTNYSYTVLAPLPITLLSFDAIKNKSTVDLFWKTSSETNNSHFDIQRSSNSKTWSNIGKTQGKGTTEQTQSYAFSDKTPQQGSNYYRLKQVDYDGTFTYSPIVSVKNKGTKINVFPNPVSNYFEVEFPDFKEGTVYTILLTNTRGQLVSQSQLQANSTRLEMDKLPFGLYTISIYDKNGDILDIKQLTKL